MTVEQMRTEIVNAYGGKQACRQFAYKVSKMPEHKVVAMYLSMKRSGRIK